MVSTVPGTSGMDIYTLGDDLLHVRGPNEITGLCGLHTGWIEARVRVLPEPPTQADLGWDAISEATLWSPSGGRLSVIGLMGDVAEALTDIAVPHGLIRVRVHARDRLDETVRTDDDPPERHELHVWTVSAETPWRTVLADPGRRRWEQKPATAAEWAMLSLVPRPSNRPAILPPLPPGSRTASPADVGCPASSGGGLLRASCQGRPAEVDYGLGLILDGLEERLGWPGGTGVILR